jgi:hypothetical protein
MDHVRSTMCGRPRAGDHEGRPYVVNLFPLDAALNYVCMGDPCGRPPRRNPLPSGYGLKDTVLLCADLAGTPVAILFPLDTV